MREILFKGKRVDNGEWVLGENILFVCSVDKTQKNACIVESGIQSEPDGKEKRVLYPHNLVIPETVGQYTGLTDKNGTKIFEGDIVNCDDRFLYVEWDEFSCCYKLKRNECLTFARLKNQEAKHSEVIGNIHDNPELME